MCTTFLCLNLKKKRDCSQSNVFHVKYLYNISLRISRLSLLLAASKVLWKERRLLLYYLATRHRQGTVLGPLLFLLYINDIGLQITLELGLFADDSVLYGVVNNISSVEVLQRDLNKLVVWPDYGRWLSMPASVFCLESLAPEIMCLNNYTYTMMGQLEEPITSVTHSFFAQENLATCVVDETHTIKTWT